MAYIGDKKVTAYYNGKQIFMPLYNSFGKEILKAPTISLDGSILRITAGDEKTETFAILVNGEEKMITIGGTWYFNKKITIQRGISANAVFFNGGIEYSYINMGGDEPSILWYSGKVVYDGVWYGESYRRISFASKQFVSKDFYDWLISNAVCEESDASGGLEYEFDLTKIYLSAGNYEISVRAMANGYADSLSKNTILFQKG
jgi:hypothetical protein